LVFDAPRWARGFFEALVADNLDIGRPELIELIFKRGQPRGRRSFMGPLSQQASPFTWSPRSALRPRCIRPHSSGLSEIRWHSR
jgi:hypothetical protein